MILFSILFFRDVNFVIRVEYYMYFIILKAFHNQNFSRLSIFLAMPVKFNEKISFDPNQKNHPRILGLTIK